MQVAKDTFRRRFHRFASPPTFYAFASRWSARFGALACVLFAVGLVHALHLAPPDYQMGDNYRIMFVHVPSAWLSMAAYLVLAFAALCGLVWRLKVADAVARAVAPLGAVFTFCALVTGSLWGKPTWGAYWIWDARLTSELILLFLFIGYIALVSAFAERRHAMRAGAVLAIVGLINLPVIHYSVVWWNTLHQGFSVAKFARPSIDAQMLPALWFMLAAFNLYFVAALLRGARVELLQSERRAEWVRQVAQNFKA